MPLVTFYFQLHQPYRLHPGGRKFLWADENRAVFEKVATKCYVPATKMFAELVRAHPNFKITLSMSGVFVKQAQMYEPKAVKALHDLYDAGQEHNQVEFLEETYHHSLTALFRDKRKREFREQVAMHRQKMADTFGARPSSFRNTELMYNNHVADVVAEMGYRAIICEKRDDMYISDKDGSISPNAVFRAKGKNGPLDLLVLPRNRELSDDVAFRFPHGELTAAQYARHIARIDGECVVLGYDYEHIGEHLWEDTGIFDFWRALPAALEKETSVVCANPTELAEKFKDSACPTVDIHPLATSSWADIERNTQGWLGSRVQQTLFDELQSLETEVKKAGGEWLKNWRQLTTSDHLYYLHEGKGADQGVHDYFSPYGSLATATYVLTRNLGQLRMGVKNFNVLRKPAETPIIIITPETARLPTQGMGKFAQFVSGKSGGLGEVVSALCKGLIARKIPTHLVTLNLSRRFAAESNLSQREWFQARHQLDPENIHLVTSSIFEGHRSAYDGDPIYTASEFQRQVANTYIRSIRSKYGGRAVIHSHDWMAGGPITAYARGRGIPVLHTIHNTHTGHVPLDMLGGIAWDLLEHQCYHSWRDGRKCCDAQATAIKNANFVSYVGRQFLHEVVNDFFLDRYIVPDSVRDETKAKHAFEAAIVIANGISPDVFPERQPENPALDKPGLATRFGPDDDILAAKRENLAKFQHKVGLRVDPDAILFYWPSRLDPMQKGVELLEDIAAAFVETHKGVQIAVVGNPVGSDRAHSDIIGRIACASNGRIAYHEFSDDMSILGYAAAADVFGASLYEPFGQIDVVGNLYGATATNRDTGGYHDKIIPLMLKALGAPQDSGNGFLFKNYDSSALWWGLSQSVKVHRLFRQKPQLHQQQMRRMMLEARKRWSLENMVAEYITAYKQLLPQQTLP